MNSIDSVLPQFLRFVSAFLLRGRAFSEPAVSGAFTPRGAPRGRRARSRKGACFLGEAGAGVPSGQLTLLSNDGGQAVGGAGLCAGRECAAIGVVARTGGDSLGAGSVAGRIPRPEIEPGPGHRPGIARLSIIVPDRMSLVSDASKNGPGEYFGWHESDGEQRRNQRVGQKWFSSVAE